MIHRKSGATAVIIAICMVLLLGFLALGLETARLYAVRSQAQTAADAASLDAVRALQDCNSGSSDRQAALTAAQAAMTRNKVDGVALSLADADLDFGRYYPYGSGSEASFVITNVNPNSVRVRVHRDATRNGPVQLTLGKLLGTSTVNVAAGAVASRDRRVVGFQTPPGTPGPLIPFSGQGSSIGPVGSAVK